MGEGAQGAGRIADLLARHGLSPRKRLGQHFLADPNVVRKIVDLASLEPGDRVVEIGAGTGTLTRALAATGSEVTAYEVDEALRPLLEEALADQPGVEFRFRDVMEAELGAELGGAPWTLVANLPYQVGTPLVLELLQRAPQIQRYVVMVQREVADRLVAVPGGKNFGLPSVVVGLYAEASGSFRVPPTVFVPPPRVESKVVRLDRCSDPDPDLRPAAIELARAAFAGRRKMLRGSLQGELDDPEAVLRAAGIDPTARPEQLEPIDFVTMAEAAR